MWGSIWEQVYNLILSCAFLLLYLSTHRTENRTDRESVLVFRFPLFRSLLQHASCVPPVLCVSASESEISATSRSQEEGSEHSHIEHTVYRTVQYTQTYSHAVSTATKTTQEGNLSFPALFLWLLDTSFCFFHPALSFSPSLILQHSISIVCRVQKLETFFLSPYFFLSLMCVCRSNKI